MKVSIDISYYPLKEEFVDPILDFIGRLQKYDEFKVVRNNFSTQVLGEYDTVMAILTKEIKNSFSLPHSVFVLKIINSDLS